MAIVDDNVLKVVEKAADAVLKRSEGWSIGQNRCFSGLHAHSRAQIIIVLGVRPNSG
jgi:hypothetical protein